MGNHEFYKGTKPLKDLIDFLGWKIYQYCSRVYQKIRNSKILVVCFLKKSSFCQNCPAKIKIEDFWDYNGVPLWSQKI